MAEKRRKYRLAMLDDLTLREVFHFRVSLLGAISMITVTIVVLLALLSVLIVYTPIRNILPGYSESIRQQIIQQSSRVDSLQTDLMLQRQYLDVIKQLTAGDIQSDSVQSLDSLQRVERTRILEQRDEVTEAFLSQYELKERDRLQLFDNTSGPSIRSLYRPVRGVITRSARPESRQYSVSVRTGKNENVLATLRGTIVSAERLEDNTFAVTLVSGSFLTVYQHVGKVLKQPGTQVESGETIGMMDGVHELLLSCWDDGQFVNPEEIIVW